SRYSGKEQSDGTAGSGHLPMVRHVAHQAGHRHPGPFRPGRGVHRELGPGVPRRGQDRLVVHRVESPGHGGAVGYPPVLPQGGPDGGGVDLRQPDGRRPPGGVRGYDPGPLDGNGADRPSPG
ncbi:HTH-type transcriptional regulator immR, partial [Dysosmobacter welbionis]